MYIALCSPNPIIDVPFQPDKFKDDPGASDSRNKKRREQHNERFVKISAAYDVLSDDKKRKAYDRFGQKGLDMLERGIDPEEAGFGGGGFGGAGYNPYQGFQGGFNQQDAYKMFENAVSLLWNVLTLFV